MWLQVRDEIAQEPICVLASRGFTTAQDAAVVMVAFIALERNKMLVVAREAAEPGKGQPPPAAAGWEGWPDRPPQWPSVSADLSTVTVTGAASQPRQGRFPAREQAQPHAPVLAGCRAAPSADAAFPSAAKSQ